MVYFLKKITIHIINLIILPAEMYMRDINGKMFMEYIPYILNSP